MTYTGSCRYVGYPYLFSIVSSTLEDDTALECPLDGFERKGATELARDCDAIDTGDIKLVLSCTGSVAHLYIDGRTLLYVEALLILDTDRL